MAQVFLLFLLCFTLQNNCHAAERPKHIPPKVWNSVKPFLLPDEHPIKPILDEIFGDTRAILNRHTMRKAGFINPKVRKWTHIIVTGHPKLPGYLFKIYLDAQRYHSNRPEHKHWVSRAKGARAVQKILDEKGWNHLFKVPRKWIYMLPKHPEPPKEFIRKNFILVEEDMDLIEEDRNKELWAEAITEEHLRALYYILEQTGLSDCIKIHNIPFAKDGRIAFIDTDSFGRGHVRYKLLLEHLSAPMQQFWEDHSF